MAIFNKPDQQADIQTNFTAISSSTVIEGTIRSKCTVQIDGKHKGIIEADGTVTVGKDGTVDGDLKANKLTVNGNFQGTADCKNVEILAGGTLRGKVISNNLTIDQNCTFEGESVKKPEAGATINKKPRDQTPGPGLPANLNVS
jgi:cytoskeletal protein CcmA (bactofilin family)